MRGVALKIPLRAFSAVRGGQRGDPADARIEPQRDALNHPAPARGIPSLEEHNQLVSPGDSHSCNLTSSPCIRKSSRKYSRRCAFAASFSACVSATCHSGSIPSSTSISSSSSKLSTRSLWMRLKISCSWEADEFTVIAGKAVGISLREPVQAGARPHGLGACELRVEGGPISRSADS
jgi:hypothetical protein